MKKIMIVEDEQSLREELKSLLEGEGYETCTLDSFEKASEDIIHSNADLILLDIQLPYKNGQVLLKEIREKITTPIIMVTSKNTEVDEVLAMSYGADDYVTKPYNPTILLLRIAAIFKRMENNTDILAYENITIEPKKGILSTGMEEVILTKNEMIIFSYLLAKRNEIVTRDNLMTELWNNNEYVNDNALTVNISRLRNKLKEIGYGNAIETRKGQGYILL